MNTIDVHNEVNALAALMGGDVSSLQASIANLQAVLTAAQGSISSLQSSGIGNTSNITQNTTDITNLQSKIGTLANLETNAKGDIVSALNEVVTEFMAFTQIDDSAVAGVTNRTWSADKIVAQLTALKNDLVGNSAQAWDTLTKITAELTNDENSIASMLTAIGTKLTAANNLSDLSSAATARTNLGLGSAATKDTGTGGGQIPVLEAGGKLPALDGSQLASVIATKLAVARTVALSGDVSGSASFDGTASVSISATLPATGVTAGTYGDSVDVPVLNVDAKGRILSATTQAIRQASITQTGVVQLTDSVSSTATDTAATPKSVKQAYDLANTANVTANAAIPATTKGAAGGVAVLDASSLIPVVNIPALDWTKITTGKPTTLAGYGILDAVSSSLIGAASGLAQLDSSGKVPAAQLPSYVDDVLEYANLAAFPATGETGKIYTALDTNKIYRWSGTVYVNIAASPGSTDSVTEGTTNLYFTAARAQAAVTSVSGNAGTASKLATPRTLSFTGAATGSGSFDGSANVSVALTLAGFDWSLITSGKPTTLSGYGITDALAASVKGAASGVAPLDSSSLLPVANLPAVAAQTNKVQSWTKSQAGAVNPLTWASSLSVDLSLANNHSVTLAGTTTMAAPTNIVAGQSGAIRITQDATGSRTMSYNTVFKFAGGTAPTLTTTAGASDLLCYYVMSATEIYASLISNVK